MLTCVLSRRAQTCVTCAMQYYYYYYYYYYCCCCCCCCYYYYYYYPGNRLLIVINKVLVLLIAAFNQLYILISRLMKSKLEFNKNKQKYKHQNQYENQYEMYCQMQLQGTLGGHYFCSKVASLCRGRLYMAAKVDLLSRACSLSSRAAASVNPFVKDCHPRPSIRNQAC